MAEVAPEARLRTKLLPNGPPVPYPVQFRIIGSDPKQLITIAQSFKDIMRQSPPLVFGVNDNWTEWQPIAKIEVDAAKARELGVPSQVIAKTLASHFGGVTIGQYREADRLLPIVIRLPRTERPS